MPARHTSEFSFCLRPSSIPDAGVGVFMVHDVCRNTLLRLKPPSPSHQVLRRSEVPSGLRHFCIDLGGGKVAVPEDFTAIHMAWYLNHDDEAPNIRWTTDGFYSEKLIRAGEELFFDYSTLQEAF